MKGTFIVFCVVAAVASATESKKPDEYFDPHVRELASAKVVRLGKNDSVHVIKESGDLAFGEILAKRNSLRCMVTVFNYGSDEGRCYALIALREMSPQYFVQALKWFRAHAPRKLRVYSGDSIMRSETSTFLDDIEAGQYRWYFEKKEREAISERSDSAERESNGG